MSHVPHALAEEFHPSVDGIRAQKIKSPHVHALSERCHEVNRAVHRAGTNERPAGDLHAAEMRSQRFALMDEVATLP